MKNILICITIFLALVSCNEEKKDVKSKTSEVKNELVAVYQTIELGIDGMTCEIGCAKIIESKISKVDGIIYSKVDFENKKGVFTYDTNITNAEFIIKKIEGIAGGDLYFPRDLKIYEKIVK